MKPGIWRVVALLGIVCGDSAFAGFGDVDPLYAAPVVDCAPAIQPLDDGGAYVSTRGEATLGIARLDARGNPVGSWGNAGTVSF
ncbi:MAG TPA: hypothetical protein VH301_02815, partial [Usitatibacter sp.]|nr:hypothetical protein [Usitatibacter sp.]